MSKMQKGIILKTFDENSVVAKLDHKAAMDNHLREGDGTGWDLTIAPGVDPLAIACITSILEHLEGQNM